MASAPNFNLLAHETPINNSTERVGTAKLDYEVKALLDFRKKAPTPRYQVTCRQRVIVGNDDVRARFHKWLNDGTAVDFTEKDGMGFSGYVALVNWSTQVPKDANPELVAYSPKTLNTAVSTSLNSGAGTSASISRTHMTGAQNSDTNTYGVHLSVGLSKDGPSGTVGGEQGGSQTSETSNSRTKSHDSGKNVSLDEGSSMSIKDWSCYSCLSNHGQSPVWVWGQEYPWDAIQWGQIADGSGIAPDFIKDRLFVRQAPPDNSPAGTPWICLAAIPPSQLSFFGVDFHMAATWLVDVPPCVAVLDSNKNPTGLYTQTLQLTHHAQVATASHWYGAPGSAPGSAQSTTPPATTAPADKNQASADDYNLAFDSVGATTLGDSNSPALDLTLLGLDPIIGGGTTNGAVIGFADPQFVGQGDKYFKALSARNNLQVQGIGFDLAAMAGTNGSRLVIDFKIADVDSEYALFMKHWTVSGDVKLRFTFYRGQASDGGVEIGSIERFVTAAEGEGGENNLLAISLRNLDFTSLDCHNYISVGLNEVTVDIECSADPAYVLRAVAIGDVSR